MSPLDRARAHLEKAEEFLAAAEMSVDMDLFNAATSSAVTSGINAKDAICLHLTGMTSKSDNHAGAVRELKEASKDTAELAMTLGRLLGLKSKAQYQTGSVAASDARKAVDRARHSTTPQKSF